MKKLLLGLATVPFLAGMALAQQPIQLSNQQMDKVTAGWSLQEIDLSNTSNVALGVWAPLPADATLTNPYLLIKSQAFNIAAQFGPK